MQGYQDVYMELSWLSFGLVFMAFMLSKTAPARAPALRQCTNALLVRRCS